MMMLIDNTVLSNFALAGELNLLECYCQGKGSTTYHVLNEFEKGVQKGIFSNTDLGWIVKITSMNEKEESLFKILCKRLGAGEASCLAIAMCRGYDLLSEPVRKTAMREGVRLSEVLVCFLS